METLIKADIDLLGFGVISILDELRQNLHQDTAPWCEGVWVAAV